MLGSDGRRTGNSAPSSGEPSVHGNEDGGENICMTIINLSSRILVTVIVGVPYALKEAGFGLGLILIMLVGLLTDYTLRLLIKAGELSNKKTYTEVMKAAFGKLGLSAVLIKQFLYPFIILVASNTLIADLLQRIISAATGIQLEQLNKKWFGQRQLLLILTLTITLPLSLYRKMSHLSKYASLSIVFLITVIIFVIVRFTTLQLPDTTDAYRFASIDAFKAMGILVAVFMGHHGSFFIFNAMIRSNAYRQNEAAHASIAVSVLIILVLGIVVYATFTGNTDGNFFNNYCSTDILMNVGRALYIMSVLLAFPGDVMIARQVIDETFFDQPTPIWRHVLITTVIVGGSVAATLLTSCLSLLLELNGVANAAPLAFIFPPVLVIRLQKRTLLTMANLPLIGVFALGSATTAFGLYRTIKTIVDGLGCSSSSDPDFCLAADGDALNWTLSNSTTVWP